MGVLKHSLKQGVPCHLLSGQIEDEPQLLKAGFATVRSIHEGDVRPLEMLMQKDVSIENIKKSAARYPALIV